MTYVAEKKASLALCRRDSVIGEDQYLPKVYVVGDHVSIFLLAALRDQKNHYILYGERLEIETVTFEEAWRWRNRCDAPFRELQKVNRYFDQRGTAKKGEWFYKWQLDMLKDNPDYNRINYFASLDA